MGWSSAGYALLNRLNSFASTSAYWTSEDYWNLATEDRGKINLHHSSGWDFYVTRNFDSDNDEMIYVQPLVTLYSTYGISGTTTNLISGQQIACSYVSRPWIENGEVIARGVSDIFIEEDDDSIIWCAQVGVSNVFGFGISAWGGLGFVGDYRFAGGLPYNTSDARPSKLKDHFWTEEGIIQGLDSAGTTYVFTAHSFVDMMDSNPFVENSDITFRLFKIYIKDATHLAGYLPTIYWLCNDRVTIEATDGLTLYIGSNEHSGKVFRDGNNLGKWAVLQSPVQI